MSRGDRIGERWKSPRRSRPRPAQSGGAGSNGIAPEKREVWLLADLREKAQGISYLDAVEEALCFGWLDGLGKKYDETRTAQRFTPRRRKSHWTALNKERARRLRAEGRMTASGEAVLPSLELEDFVVAKDIERALREANAWTTFESFPPLYQRVRVGYVEEQRNSEAGKMFGTWDDRGLRRSVGVCVEKEDVEPGQEPLLSERDERERARRAN